MGYGYFWSDSDSDGRISLTYRPHRPVHRPGTAPSILAMIATLPVTSYLSGDGVLRYTLI